MAGGASVHGRRDTREARPESGVGLHQAELIWCQGPWRTADHFELATIEYVDWLNYRRLHGEIGHMPPAEFEETFYGSRHEAEIEGRKSLPNPARFKRVISASLMQTGPMAMSPSPRPRSLLEPDGHYGLRNMPVQAKAFRSGWCHLERDHGVDVRGLGAAALLERHLLAHGLDPVPNYSRDCLPWKIRSLPHEMLGEQGKKPHR